MIVIARAVVLAPLALRDALRDDEAQWRDEKFRRRGEPLLVVGKATCRGCRFSRGRAGDQRPRAQCDFRRLATPIAYLERGRRSSSTTRRLTRGASHSPTQFAFLVKTVRGT